MSLIKNKKKIVHYLEMLSQKEFVPSGQPESVYVLKPEIRLPTLNRFFYIEVGKLWHWNDRSEWSIEDWENWVSCEKLYTWILIYKETPAGYFELFVNVNDVEIAHFGLLPIFIGKG